MIFSSFVVFLPVIVILFTMTVHISECSRDIDERKISYHKLESFEIRQKNAENSLWPTNSNRVEFNESLIHFYVYTKDNPDERQEIILGDVDSLERSNIKPGAHLKVLTHGYLNSESQGFPQTMKNEFLRVAIEDLNIITMDYGLLVVEPYVDAVENSKLIAVKGAEFLEFLIREQIVTRDKIHIIGYSLGAQVAGMIGSHLLEPAARITALDPAGPLYEDFDDADRIDSSDADFVDVIHTAGGTLGFLGPRGHADFYPNGGSVQPGCGDDVGGGCAHDRAPLFMEESLGIPLGFQAQMCDSWDNYTNGSCISNQYATMGYFTLPSTRGIFYLTTNSQSPFGQG